jgi:predicted AlkP superfamily pyrophosphatase or phosphodiesterase
MISLSLKSYTCLIIILLSLLSVNSQQKPKERVLLIGIDGLLKKCIPEANFTALLHMIQNGSYTFKARTNIETLSAPGWSGILCGMDSESTGIFSNDWVAPWFYGKPDPITPATGNSKPIPCIFEQIKVQNPTSKVAAFFGWDWFTSLTDASIPNSIDFEDFCLMDEVDQAIKCDDRALIRAKEIISKDFDFFFVYLGSLDEMGHAQGFCSDKYIGRLQALNIILEDIFNHLRKEGKMDDTHIILTSDHGAEYLKKYHGIQDNDNIFVPWVVMGPDVKKNYLIENPIRNEDTAPTVLKLLGLKPPQLWRGRAVDEVFSYIKEEKENIMNMFLN